MQHSIRQASFIVAFFLLVTVVTQVIYIGLRSAEIEFDSHLIWTVEAVAFLAIATFAFVPIAQGHAHSAAWAAITLGGVFNSIQVGMGLAMFDPVVEAGEASAPAFQSILAGAFFLYFTGKFLFGFAGLLLGLHMIQTCSGPAKAIGGLAAIAGLGAMGTNIIGMSVGMDVVMLAGGAGTAATAFLAIAIGMLVRSEKAARP